MILTYRTLRAVSQQNNLLPLIFFGFIGHVLLQGQIVSMGVIQGYTWIFVGLVMAAYQKNHVISLPSADKVYFPKIVGTKAQFTAHLPTI